MSRRVVCVALASVGLLVFALLSAVLFDSHHYVTGACAILACGVCGWTTGYFFPIRRSYVFFLYMVLLMGANWAVASLYGRHIGRRNAVRAERQFYQLFPEAPKGLGK